LAAAALALGCAGAPLPPAGPEPAAPEPTGLRVFVPGPVLSLLSLDLAQLRRSAWAKPVLASAAPAEGRQGRGFDEIEDVDAWLFARVRAPGAGIGTLELGRGRFDRGEVLAAFRRRHPGAREQRFAGRQGLADANGAMVFLDEGILALGPSWAIEAAARAGETPVVREPWLAEAAAAVNRLGGARPARAAVELWLRFDDAMRTELAEVVGNAEGVDWLAAQLRLAGDAQAVAVASTRGPNDAVGLAAQLSDQLAALQGRRSVRALGLGPVLEGVRVQAQGGRVLLDLGISESDREVVAERLAVLAQALAKARAEARTEGAP
jgi:hypothetical protein